MQRTKEEATGRIAQFRPGRLIRLTRAVTQLHYVFAG